MSNLISNLSNNLILIIFLMAMGLSFYIGGKLQAPEIITKTRTTTVIDTTAVDSLQSIIEYYESIEPDDQDTVYIDEGDVDDIFTETSRKITTTHTDSMIVARNYLELNLSGEIVENRFSYLLKRRLVRDRQTTITRNITVNTTTETTRTIKEGMFFQAGILTNLDYITPVVGVTTRNKITFLYGYDPFTKTHTAGILAKF